MRFLADENFPLPSVRLLNESGHDAAAIASEEPSVSDERVLYRAFREDRIVLTFDRDYGWLLCDGGFEHPQQIQKLASHAEAPSLEADLIEREEERMVSRDHHRLFDCGRQAHKPVR